MYGVNLLKEPNTINWRALAVSWSQETLIDLTPYLIVNVTFKESEIVYNVIEDTVLPEKSWEGNPPICLWCYNVGSVYW